MNESDILTKRWVRGTLPFYDMDKVDPRTARHKPPTHEKVDAND